MSHPFDATLKEIVSQAPSDFQGAFRLPTMGPVQTINVDLSTISAATDVALGFGRPLREIVDLNFQSGPDSTTAARLHFYNAVLHLKYSVPIRSVLVLLRPKADSPKLTGELTYVSGGKRVVFEYETIRLWQEPVEPFLEGGVGLLPLAMLCKMPSGRPIDESLHEVVREVDHRLAAMPDHGHAVRLMTAAFNLARSRIPKETVFEIFEGASIMHKLTAWDEMEEAMIQTTKRNLLSLGRSKFGEPEPKDEKALNRIKELSRLDRMISAFVEMNSWKDLLAVR